MSQDNQPPADKPRDHLTAVGWMGGPDVLSRLGVILRDAQRPNAWMHVERGKAHDETARGSGEMITLVPPTASDPHDTVWFDYIADLGDDTDSMYAVAYGLYVTLASSTNAEPQVGDVLQRRIDPASTDPDTLPRGRFLFLGGDTAYHVADAVTLTQRVRDPFDWAYDDARRDDPHLVTHRTRLYGIPGNHDWYDHLDGFAKVFRREHVEPIALKGFEPMQTASYTAIQLPHGWQLWGLDIYPGVDPDQKGYFKSLGAVAPDRLILCTPSPPRAFHSVHLADHHDESLRELGIPRGYPKDGWSGPGSRARLDLSGDIHHYARYVGPADGYTSIVSGLGGAFHHPTFTAHSDLGAVRMYPEPSESLRAIGGRLLDPRTMLVGSWFRAFPFLVGILFAFAAIGSGAAQWFLRAALSWLPVIRRLQLPSGDRAEGLRSIATAGWVLLAAALVAGAAWWFRVVSKAHEEDPRRRITLPDARILRRPWTFFRLDRSYWASTALVGVAIAALALVPVLPFAPTGAHPMLDVATLLVGAATVIGGFVFAFVVGSKGLSTVRRIALASSLGVVHAVLQLVTPFVFAMSAGVNLVTLATALGVNLLLSGVLIASRLLFKKSTVLGLALGVLAVLAWWGGLAALVHHGSGATVAEWSDWRVRALAVIVGALLAIIPCCCLFTWYLAVAALFDAHNNEVGGAARVTQFRQLIRFKLSGEGLTGYVIAIENTKGVSELAALRDPKTGIQFKVVDRFTIAA